MYYQSFVRVLHYVNDDLLYTSGKMFFPHQSFFKNIFPGLAIMAHFQKFTHYLAFLLMNKHR